MPGQLFTYYIENPLVISINSGSWGCNGIRLGIETWVNGKGGNKEKEQKKEGVGRERDIGAARFCGPCGYFGVFLLL
jgi:hypothetical protein